MSNRFCSVCSHLICPECIELGEGEMICSRCKRPTRWSYVQPQLTNSAGDNPWKT